METAMCLDMSVRYIRSLIGLYLLSWLVLPVHASSISMDISIDGSQIGVIQVWVDTSTSMDMLTGGFSVTKVDASGEVLSLFDLEKLLGPNDHLNWFQVVLADSSPRYSANVPYIDPLNGDRYPSGADDRPWYWDEVNVDGWDPYSLAYNTDPIRFGSSNLHYSDTPLGGIVSFETFLINDHGDSTYDVLGGFAWHFSSSTIDQLSPNADFFNTFVDDQRIDLAELIRRDFGYLSSIPEPRSEILGITAILIAGLFSRYRSTRLTPIR